MSWAHSLALRTFVCLEPHASVPRSSCVEKDRSGVHLTDLAHTKRSAPEFSPFSLPCPAWAGREGCPEGRKGLGVAFRLPEGSYLNCCQPASVHSEAERVAGRCCPGKAVCARGAGHAGPAEPAEAAASAAAVVTAGAAAAAWTCALTFLGQGRTGGKSALRAVGTHGDEEPARVGSFTA